MLMDCIPHYIPYQATNSFANLALDYLQGDEKLQPYFSHPPNWEGMSAAMRARLNFPTNRQLLRDELMKQYEGMPLSSKLKANLDALGNANCFTVCTAHQPNLFSGYLYFVYKILHAIRLADEAAKKFPGNHFVPVFFLGSEDNDLEELNHIYLDGEELVWPTRQSGAVGRMKPEQLKPLLDRIAGQMSVLPFGAELMEILADSYLNTASIQDASFKLVNRLFGEYGLVVLMPDNANLKRQLSKIFEKELFEQESGSLVEATSKTLGESYKVQVNPRDINLFYLEENIRERIVQNGSGFNVLNTDLHFSPDAMKQELQSHPDRFSPNVILRGLYQEYILPNIAFIGGGSELAYWLELKSVFEHHGVPFPVLVLRNSFLLLSERCMKLMNRLGLENEDLFKSPDELFNILVKKESELQLDLKKEKDEMEKYYKGLAETAGKIDKTLTRHVDALFTKAMKKIDALEKKMLRAEKRKFESLQHQVQELKDIVYPTGKLQERVENILPYYAQYGPSIIDCLYKSSLTLEQEFTVLSIG